MVRDRYTVSWATSFSIAPQKSQSTPAVTPVKPSTFDPTEAVEAILYIAERLKRPTLHEILKICYFADGAHLSQHGTTATGDNYFAMYWGPVASEIYNLLKAGNDEDSWVKASYLPLVADAFDVKKKINVVIKRGPLLDYLSQSARDAFDWAIREYGDLDFGDRTALSHDQAWSKVWNARPPDADRAEMSLVDIATFLSNAPEVLEYLHA